MMPPTSIDGTDITGATIDGQDVQEITVDGQTVFSAQTFPVAYSNLVAWYPFDSATYGGSNADDVTAILGGSGDDTAYDGTVSGATYQASGGVTDINAGANSGAFDFDGSNDSISLPSITQITGTKDRTYTMWFKTNTTAERGLFGHGGYTALGSNISLFCDSGGFRLRINGGNELILSSTYTTGEYVFVSFRISGSNLANALVRVRSENDSSFSQDDFGGISQSIDTGTEALDLGVNSVNDRFHNGIIEDFRIYDRNLTNSEEESIYLNTEP